MQVNIPDSLPYDRFYPLNELGDLKDKLCYFIKAYKQQGVSLTISRNNGLVCIRASDFFGKILQPTDKDVSVVMTEYSRNLIYTLKLIGVEKAQCYFSTDDKPRLVDIRFSLNKFCSPGYLSEFFGRQNIPIQENLCNPLILTSDIINSISKKEGIYNTDFIIKPDVFKFIMKDNKAIPLYGFVNNAFETS